MKYSFNIGVSNDIAIDIINKNISKFDHEEDIDIIKQLFQEALVDIRNIFSSEDVIKILKSKMMYHENIYSKERTKENIFKARDRVVQYLREIIQNININVNINDELTEDIAIIILKRILNNFYKHIEAMYREPVHSRGGIKKEMLDKIKITNEYDVQRILYSVIKPIFPSARLEVSNDTGFSTIRYDIFIEEFSVVIEVKCSRGSMNEKKLTEEIGSDIFHYKYNNIFFFIYDKEKIIKNSDAFIHTYNKKFEEKR